MPSTIQYRGPWKAVPRRVSEPDRWLDEMGFFRKHTARDASCLFRAVSESIYNTQLYFHKVRQDCVQFIATRRQLFEGLLSCPFENYLRDMSKPSEWGGLVEITALSHLYRRDFVIFEANKGPHTKICNGYGNIVFLFYSPEAKHFDVMYTKDYLNTLSFCQSIVYNILYEGVYQIKDLPYAVDKMLHDKVPTNHIEYFMSENVERRKKHKERAAKMFMETSDERTRNYNAVALKCKHHTQDVDRNSLLKESLSIFVFNRSLIQLENVCMNCLNVNSAKDLLDNGITPFPYKVAKALDPDIYRNIEFDVWNEVRREIRFGYKYSDGMTLQVGVKCFCKLEVDQMVPYHCHIQEMRPDGGPCVVFVEELGEKRLVDFDQLEPLPHDEMRPWAPPYRYSRPTSQFMTLSQMLQQIGNMTRKHGIKSRKSKCCDEPKTSEKVQKQAIKLSWKNETTEVSEMTRYIDHDSVINHSNVNYSTYEHVDILNFNAVPVELETLPLMVDCRPAAGAPHELAAHTHAHANGAGTGSAPPPQDNQHNPATNGGVEAGAGGGGAGGGPGRAGTPHTPHTMATAAAAAAAATALTTYTGGMSGTSNMSSMSNMGGQYMPNVGAPYMCGMKPVVWCAPHSPPPHMVPPHAPPHHAHTHAPPLPPPPVNLHVYKSVQANGADLPMNDIPTLRYYFNLGVECMWASYGPPPPPAQPPRHYSHRDLAQDIQQMSIHDRPAATGVGGHGTGGDGHKQGHKPVDSKPPGQHKGNGQRPLLGPRFKRGNHQDGNQNHHSQNKGHNNMPNKGMNNNRRMHVEGRMQPPAGMGYGAGAGGAEPECVMEPQLITLPYMPYPPPMYPVSYYPVESDPGMMGMMGGYVGYDEGVEYPPVHYYPAPHYAPHAAPLAAPHAAPLPAPPAPPPQASNAHPHHAEHK